MEPIPRQSRRLLWLLVLTVAWQAFAYGWIVTTAELRVTWPPSDMGRTISDAWQETATPPLAHFLNHVVTRIAQNATNIPRMRVWMISFLAFLIHTILVSHGLVIAGKHTRNEAAPLWGYILTALNPFLMVLVARHQWLTLLALVLGAAAYLSFLQERWTRGWILYLLGTLIHPVLLLWIGVPLAVLFRHATPNHRYTFSGAFIFVWGGMALIVRPASFVKGLSQFWYGGLTWPDIGWNLFSFMKIISFKPEMTGLLSLMLMFLMTIVIILAYKKQTLSIRSLPAAVALGAWLLFWRAQFLEFGIALYWVAVLVAHRTSFYHEPLLTHPDASDPA